MLKLQVGDRWPTLPSGGNGTVASIKNENGELVPGYVIIMDSDEFDWQATIFDTTAGKVIITSTNDADDALAELSAKLSVKEFGTNDR